MKQKPVVTFLSVLLIASVFFFVPSCGKKSADTIQPITKSSFEEVTSQLNPKGTFYLYASTEQILKWVDEFFIQLQSPEMTSLMGEKSSEGLAAIKWLHSMFKESGLLGIDGVGMSTVPIEEHLNHSTFTIHRVTQQSDDLFSQLTKQEPMALDNLKLLPAHTALAFFGSPNLSPGWKWFSMQVDKSNLLELKTKIAQMKEQLMQGGVDLDRALACLNGQMGMIITLDEKHPITLPIDDQALSLPEPGLAFLMDTADETLFDLLRKSLPMAVFTDKDGAKRLSIPSLPLPFDFSPIIEQRQGQLFIASSGRILEAIDQSRLKGDGLVSSSEFKTLSKYMLDKGNGFRYISPRLMKTIMTIPQHFMANNSAKPEALAGLKLLNSFVSTDLSLYSVVQHQKDGILVKMNHSFSASHMLILPAISAVGIISAIAIPNFMVARQKAQAGFFTEPKGNNEKENNPDSP